LISGPSDSLQGSLAPALSGSPVALTLLPQLVRPVHPWKDYIAFRRLTEWFRAGAPLIVHTHSGKAGFLGRLAASKAGVPVIVHTIHGPSFGAFQGPIPNTLFKLAERRAGRVTTHFVAVANAMTEQYLAAGIGRREQYSRILSGFDVAPSLSAVNDPRQRARWGLESDHIVVGMIARLFDLKGHDDLLAVAPALLRGSPRIRFLLVGGGARRGALENQIRSLGLQQQFVFTGLVDPRRIPDLIGIMDMVVHLSRREGLPRALPQALAAARPVVAYDCDGAKEVCIEGETGFLLRPGDLQGLTDRVLQLAADAALRERLGTRGRILVKDEFRVEKMIDDLERLYRKLAASRGIVTP
jgi:glycosyltransferase involved in cell wall biosynthesis